MGVSSVTSALLIGYGSIGRYHARLLQQAYNQVAVVDINDDVRTRVHDDYPDFTVAQGLKELALLGWEWESTMAVIATWGPSHSDVFHNLIRHGVRHILCEKPIAYSVAAGAEMVRAAEKLAVTLGVHHRFRYTGFVKGLGPLTEELGIGEPCALFIHGGARGLVTNGIHYIDLASELFGRGPELVVSSAVGEPINPRSSELMYYGGTAVWSFGEGREAVFSFTNRSSVFGTVSIYYRDAVVDVSPNFDVEVRRRVAEEVRQFPAVTRSGMPSDIAFKGPVPGIRSGGEATTMLYDEIVSGSVRVCPPALALEAVGACIGALAAGRDRQAVQLPIDPVSELGRTPWPIS